MRRWSAMAILGGAIFCGCEDKSASQPAEVPKPGPAASPQPGMAPSGQSEPSPGDAAPGHSEKDAAATGAPAPPAGEQIETAAFSKTDGQPADVDVQVLDWKQVEALVASHQGQVVVVDMWSLSCDPCRREFPNLVKLHREQGAAVACISVSTDYAGIKSKPPEFYRGKVLEFLTKQQATFENVLCSVDSETLFDQLALASIPAVYVYGKDGQLAQRFTGEEVHYDTEVAPLVQKLLK